MFAKLLKYEWKATSGTLSVLGLCFLGASAVTAVLLRIWLGMEEGMAGTLMGMFVASLLLFLGMGLVVYSIGGLILLLIRFYKHKFTDEGYLTFTLPAKSRDIFLSALVNTLAWMLFITLVVIASVVIVALVGLWDELVENHVFEVAEEILKQVNGETILNLVMVVVNSAANIVVMMCCITMGAVGVKKHKLLVSVGIFYAVSTVRNSVSTTIMMFTMMDLQDFQTVMTRSNACEFFVGLVFAVAGYFLSIHMMEKKLNLP